MKKDTLQCALLSFFCELDRHAVTGAHAGVLKFWKDS